MNRRALGIIMPAILAVFLVAAAPASAGEREVFDWQCGNARVRLTLQSRRNEEGIWVPGYGALVSAVKGNRIDLRWRKIDDGVYLNGKQCRPWERDMTCSGTVNGTNDIRAVGLSCIIQNNPKAIETVEAACRPEHPCVVRARVVPRDTPNVMPQSYTVLEVYSAQEKK